MSKRLIVLEKKETNNLSEFIQYWKNLYHYPDEGKYKDNIRLDILTSEQLTALFTWKNGMTLEGSGKKEQSFKTKILSRLDYINQYKKNPDAAKEIDLAKFIKEFADVSAVWGIFVLHIIQPDFYPIYDQHVHRAHEFITGGDWESITNTISNQEKIDFYFNHYLPFVQGLGNINRKEMDEAFFAFGQFLKLKSQHKMLTE